MGRPVSIGPQRGAVGAAGRSGLDAQGRAFLSGTTPKAWDNEEAPVAIQRYVSPRFAVSETGLRRRDRTRVGAEAGWAETQETKSRHRERPVSHLDQRNLSCRVFWPRETARPVAGDD